MAKSSRGIRSQRKTKSLLLHRRRRKKSLRRLKSTKRKKLLKIKIKTNLKTIPIQPQALHLAVPTHNPKVQTKKRHQRRKVNQERQTLLFNKNF